VKAILSIVHRHIERKNLLTVSHFDFRVRHSTILQYMRLTEHVTINFNKNISADAIALDIDKAFDTAWYPILLYELLKLKFSLDHSFQTEHSRFRLKMR
jgi:hypothetical protein